jgi:hypothetical protein
VQIYCREIVLMSEFDSNEAHLEGPIEDNQGPKLPYFHRTLSDAETALIGDISPKLIDKKSSIEVDTASSAHSLSSAASWNSAGTYESR